MEMNRRAFLNAAALGAAGLAMGVAARSARADLVVREGLLPPNGLPGLSKKQLDEHFGLYRGYVKGTHDAYRALSALDYENLDATLFRGLKQKLSYSLDGAILHELYFENLGGEGGMPAGEVAALIQKAYGSPERWAADFKATGKAARGWVILALDPKTEQVQNFLCDLHDQGGIWGGRPLLVMDVYEHAYMIDYGTDRGAYLDAFMKNVNWPVVNRRL
jgi:Fe-Mn family superoxide dismutase